MVEPAAGSASLALIDDDVHSAALLMRVLAEHGEAAVHWCGGADTGRHYLAAVLGDFAQPWPDVVLVDLKAHSLASVNFVRETYALLSERGVPAVVMLPPHDRRGRQAAYEAGAAAVFFRQPERDAYRREAAGILSFSARYPRLDAVGM